jgi:protein-glutamine gamma-glutamyltransferase
MAGTLSKRLSLRAIGGRMGDQWERDRRETLFLMGAILMTMLAQLPHLPWWTSAGFMLLFIWRLGLVLSGRALPGAAVRLVAAVAATAAVYAHYHTLIGRDAGVALLTMFLGLKMMEMRARRDLFVVLFICFFLLLTTFFNSQSLLTSGVCMAAVVTLIATMVTMQFGQHELAIARRFKLAAVMLVQAVPIAIALFVLFPRLNAPLWGLPNESHAARTGMSDSMAPGNIAQLSKSSEVAFRVLFTTPRPRESQLYWRGPVLGDFDGRTWRPLSNPLVKPPRAQFQFDGAAKQVKYALTVEPSNQQWLFALDAPVKVDKLAPQLVQLGSAMELLAREPIVERVRYEAESVLDYSLGLNESELTLRNWLALPAGFNPQTLGLASKWREQTDDPQTMVTKALKLFNEEPFHYTLNAPLLGKHSVDDFLFKTRAGFCEHYASSFVMLMRALDVPARVVTGYQGGQLNPVDNYWVVRQADAHAWAEVWIAKRGWVRVDPVAAVAPQRIENGSMDGLADFATDAGPEAWIQSWKLNIDALTNAWNQWVLSYDNNKQQQLIGKLGLSNDNWRDMAGLLAGVLTLLIGAAALITLHPRRPKNPIERWYDEFCERLGAVGLARAPHESAAMFIERVSLGLDATQLTDARRIMAIYNALRYASDGSDLAAIRTLRTLVSRFRP